MRGNRRPAGALRPRRHAGGALASPLRRLRLLLPPAPPAAPVARLVLPPVWAGAREAGVEVRRLTRHSRPRGCKADSTGSRSCLRPRSSARPRRGNCPAPATAKSNSRPCRLRDNLAIADQFPATGQRGLACSVRPFSHGTRLPISKPARGGPGGEVKAGGVGEPVEGDEGPARLQGFPHGLLAQLRQQQVGADMPQAVLIRVETQLEQHVARFLVLRQRLKGGELPASSSNSFLPSASSSRTRSLSSRRTTRPMFWWASLAATPVCGALAQSWSQRRR